MGLQHLFQLDVGGQFSSVTQAGGAMVHASPLVRLAGELRNTQLGLGFDTKAHTYT